MTDTDLSARLDRIVRLTDQLAAVQRESLAAQLLLVDLHRELARARHAPDPPNASAIPLKVVTRSLRVL